MAKKIDKRIKYHIVVDVETAGGFGNPLVYDVGFVITDRQGRIYETKSFIIKEIWQQTDLMDTAYYSKKIPLYKTGIEQGKHKIVSFNTMRKEMFDLMDEYNVKVFCAYNLAFDMNALQNTASNLQGEKVYFLDPRFKDLELNCIWCLACQVLYTQKYFGTFAVKNGFVSEVGNYRTTAEVGYNYIKSTNDFEEEHTGLADALIETEIMAYSYRQKQKHEKGIISQPWRIPQKD